MNNEEDNADGIAFANAADFQDKVYETHSTIFSLKMRQNLFFPQDFVYDVASISVLLLLKVLQEYTESAM